MGDLIFWKTFTLVIFIKVEIVFHTWTIFPILGHFIQVGDFKLVYLLLEAFFPYSIYSMGGLLRLFHLKYLLKWVFFKWYIYYLVDFDFVYFPHGIFLIL